MKFYNCYLAFHVFIRWKAQIFGSVEFTWRFTLFALAARYCEGPSLSESCVGLACDADERLLRPLGSVTGSFFIGLGAIAPFSVKGVGDYCKLVKLQQPKHKPEKEKISPDTIDNWF